jgi:mRNA interferase MazF
MTGYKRGAIVLLPFPFSDQSSAKNRPAVVVNQDYPSDDLLVVAITSVGDILRPGEFAIQFWREAGLIHPHLQNARSLRQREIRSRNNSANCANRIWQS